MNTNVYDVAYDVIEMLVYYGNKVNNRYNWKMLRFTLYIWEGMREYTGGKLRKKVDTVRHVINSRKFAMFYDGHYQYGRYYRKYKSYT